MTFPFLTALRFIFAFCFQKFHYDESRCRFNFIYTILALLGFLDLKLEAIHLFQKC